MRNKIVINTGPILTLVAGLGSLNMLKELYDSVYVTNEVADEIMFDGSSRFAAKEFEEAEFLIKIDKPIEISPLLKNMLDVGEASVIQYALYNQIKLVCIDESAGRRVARLNELRLTGSIGVLLRAKSEGYIQALKPIINRMLEHGIYMSPKVISFALNEAKEI